MSLPIAPVPLPATWLEAALRAITFKCPRCGGAHLFGKWLKPVERCSACGQDWSIQQADDFPAYVAIIVTGHILAPLMILFGHDLELPPLVSAALLVSIALVMLLGMLQPAKGGVIATQWWFGLHGFKRERPAGVE